VGAPTWLDNRRAVRLRLSGLAVVLSSGAIIFVALGPLLRVPGGWLLLAYVALSFFAGFVFTRHQPFKVSLDESVLVVRWLVLGSRIDLRGVEKADFLISARQLDLAWNSRYYDLRLHVGDGRSVNVGSLDGPVARKILDSLPAGRARLRIWSDGKVVEERGLEPSRVETPDP